MIFSYINYISRSLLEEVMELRTKTWNELQEDSSIRYFFYFYYQRQAIYGYEKTNLLFRLEELAAVFGGEQKLNKIQPNKKLQKWLIQRSKLYYVF